MIYYLVVMVNGERLSLNEDELKKRIALSLCNNDLDSVFKYSSIHVETGIATFEEVTPVLNHIRNKGLSLTFKKVKTLGQFDI